MADNSAERNLSASLNKVAKYAYWILGIILIGGISYFFYNNLQRQITSVLFFLCGVIVLYFYYVKWFVVPEKKPDWAPYSTPCPDYLTVMAEAGSGNMPNGAYKCFDFVGVSRRPDGIKKADPRMFAQQKNNPQYYFMVDPRENKESLRQRVLAQGLTWTSLFGDN
jgi:hypothetical protein